MRYSLDCRLDMSKKKPFTATALGIGFGLAIGAAIGNLVAGLLLGLPLATAIVLKEDAV